MNRKIYSLEQTDSIDIYQFTEDELKVINEYVDISGKIYDLLDFYQILVYNLEAFKKQYDIFYNDEIIRKDGKMATSFEVNAHFISISSSARSVMEIIESTLKKLIDGDRFKEKYISKKYDESFSYRIMYFIRNYSQHGHLPITEEEGFYSIDLNVFLTEMDHNIKGKEKKDFEEIRDRIYQKGFPPRIACVMTLIQYIADVTEICKEFLLWIKNYFDEIEKKVARIISDIDEGVIYYAVDGNTAHCIMKDLGMKSKVEDGITYFTSMYDKFFEYILIGKKTFTK